MKFKVLVEYEYPIEHKLPVKAEIVLHGDRVVTDNIKWIEQEPTTKNNLGVDCISREQALVAIRNLYPGMPRVDFNGSLRKWVDKYKPYIECDDAIKQLPSVTPQPKMGYWIDADGDNAICGCCNRLNHLYGTYCKHCGAKMVEPQESENP